METRIIRKPNWIRSKIPAGATTGFVNSKLKNSFLNTVCEEARCPNQADCWNSGTATFLIMGKTCTRNCRFCAIKSGSTGEILDKNEPFKLARTAKELGLKYVVVTSVDRDDLPDFGAEHFVKCITEIKKNGMNTEVLIPDFQGRIDCLKKIVLAKPNVICHNLEVVERLQKTVRDQRASYNQSLKLLHNIKLLDATIYSKSSLMLGFGETEQEVLETMDDLRDVDCDFLTLGQYLQPSKQQIPVAEFVLPKKFEDYKKIALEKGFKMVVAGPLVRSSYKAGDFFEGKSSL